MSSGELERDASAQPGDDACGSAPPDAAVGDWADAWLWSSRHPVAAELEGAAPGPGLAARLARLEHADLDEPALVEVVAAWERVASWAAAAQARAIEELRSRPRGPRGAFLADDVAARLSTSRAVAEAKVALAIEVGRVPALGDGLARGDLDVRRAMVLADELGRLPDAAAREVAEAVLPAARTCTAPQLRVRLRRMEIRRDPDGAARRHERARSHRRVELLPAPDAMAWISAYLPADDAVAVHTCLTALAGDAAPDDGRTLDERRADALVDLTVRWLDAGVHPDGGPLTTRQGRRPHLTVTATASMLLGLGDEPAELAGYGPIPPEMARRIAATATWEPLLVDRLTGEPLARSARRYAPTQRQRDAVVQRDRTCTFPGCRVPAARCDLDHLEPYDAAATDQDQTRTDNLQALCRHHHRAKTHAGWAPRRSRGGGTLWRAPTGQLYVRPPEHDPPPAPRLPDGGTIDLYPPVPPLPDGVTRDLYPPPPF